MVIESVLCLHCEHSWIKRVDNPKQCPNCNAKNYFVPKRPIGRPRVNSSERMSGDEYSVAEKNDEW